MPTFIVDCPNCRAKVGADESGSATNSGFNEYIDEPYSEKLSVGCCPKCKSLLAGYSYQVAFKNWEGEEEDVWSDVTRVYPNPPKAFSSSRIPKTVTDSLLEADRTLQAGAFLAACLMFGRALEGVCRNVLEKRLGQTFKKPPMLGAGIKALKDNNIIDQRLYDWSQQLHAFRNLAAHPDDEATVSKVDAEDLQSFVYAIIEYIYDLTDRYEDFKARLVARKARKKKSGKT